MCNRWYWDINALKLQEKQEFTILYLNKQLFSDLAYSMTSIDKSTQSW